MTTGRVAPHEVGRTARMRLVFASDGGRTTLGEGYAEAPWKIPQLFHHPSGIAQLTLMSAGPGLLGGDRLSASVEAGANARALITTQSALKIHPSHDGALAQHETRVRVAAGGELHLHGEPLIPFSGSRLDQRLTIDLVRGARFYGWDAWMAGRVARGERWAFRELRVELAVRVDGVLSYLDRYALDDTASPSTLLAMQRFDYLGTAIVFDERLDGAMLDALPAELFSDATADAARGAFDLPAPGLMIGRVLAADGAALRRVYDRYQELLFERVLHEPRPHLRK